ncbi:MAG: ATP synthase F1 subunit delta [Acidobacteria bacterium]|nr:ATP synthase F1 subunit delta [Acidobacteriota bacterium]
MTPRTAASRYARALLDVASKEADIDQVGTELDGFLHLLKRQPALERVLLNPVVPAPRKKAAMIEVAKLAGWAPVVANLLVLLAERDRLGLLRDLTATYHDLLLERQNIVRAEITSAEALPNDRIKSIEKRLASVTGRRLSMVTKVDKDILGGVIARVGGTVFDASVATQLKKIRQRLTT